MLKRTVLGIVALVASTSCVPADSGVRATPHAREVAAAQTLLERLDLTAPTGPLDQAIASPATAKVLTAAPPFLGMAARSLDDRQRAVDCLTAAVYYEARSESEDGQRAVAQVVLNRVRDRAFPGSVCGVVYQGSTRRTGCQFSFTCDGSMRHPLEPAAWDRARAVAEAAFAGYVYAPIGASTYYHATSVLPWWASSFARVGQIGSHIFYRWRGFMERALAFRQDYAGVEPGRATQVADASPTAADLGALDSGVTVHRGQSAPEPGSTPPPTRPTMVAGVRIHVGVPARRAEGNAATGGGTPFPILSISDESDPT